MTAALPAGWRVEPLEGAADAQVIFASPGLGAITIDFGRREFRLGYGVLTGRLDSERQYDGPGWREQIVADAVKALQAAVRPADPLRRARTGRAVRP